MGFWAKGYANVVCACTVHAVVTVFCFCFFFFSTDCNKCIPNKNLITMLLKFVHVPNLIHNWLIEVLVFSLTDSMFS